jgi:hypothetical protein
MDMSETENSTTTGTGQQSEALDGDEIEDEDEEECGFDAAYEALDEAAEDYAPQDAADACIALAANLLVNSEGDLAERVAAAKRQLDMSVSLEVDLREMRRHRAERSER